MVSRIKALAKEKGISLAFICSQLGLGRSYFQDLQKNNRDIPQERLEIIAKILGTTCDYLLGNTDIKEKPAKKGRGIKIPVLGEVPAGIPIEAVEDIIDYEEITPEMARLGDHFALLIKGDSMAPRMVRGDVVVVRKQDYAETGDTVIVLINGADATCKKIKITEKGWTLLSTNPAYDPMFYSRKEVVELPVQILGKVVELRGKF